MKPPVALPLSPPHSRHLPTLQLHLLLSSRPAFRQCTSDLALLPLSALAPCNIHGTTDHPMTQTCMHMYKTTESPLLGINGGDWLSGSFFHLWLGNYHLHYSYLDRLCFGLLRCVHGVFDLGCVLVNHRLYARFQHPQGRTFSIVLPSVSPTHPHADLPSTCLYPSLSPSDLLSCFVLSRFLSCGHNSLYLCYAVHTLSITLHHASHKPVSQTQSCSLFIAHSSSLFFFLLAFARSLNKISPSLLELFPFSNSFNFDASSQVVGKNGKLKSGNT